MKLRKELTALRFGDLRVGSTLNDGSIRIKTGKLER
jgi:hypothetical protein